MSFEGLGSDCDIVVNHDALAGRSSLLVISGRESWHWKTRLEGSGGISRSSRAQTFKIAQRTGIRFCDLRVF